MSAGHLISDASLPHTQSMNYNFQLGHRISSESMMTWTPHQTS